MSSYVYGPTQYLPINEQHPVRSVNPYMGSKLLGESLCKQFSEQFKIPLVILRGFNIYGNVLIPGRLISDLIESIKLGKSLVLNDQNPKRDYLYIEDFKALILKIICQKPSKTKIYNVGSGTSYSNLEVANMAHEIAQCKDPIVIKSTARLNDILDCTVDINLLKETFEWSPKYSLRQGLNELISLHSKN